MALLSSEETRLIRDAVAAAEEGTAGEIATAIIAESDDYAFRELLFSMGAGILTYIILALFAAGLNGLLDRWFWYESAVLLPLAMGTASMAAGLLFYALFQIPALDRLIVGRKVMTEAARRRSLRYFVECGIYDTVDRTGVLLFISVLERRVELIADKGINTRVAPDTWDRIVSSLVRGIREKRTAQSIVRALEEIGVVLAEHVPRRPDDANELSDGPVELGKNS
jgi:putative membrane protein